MATALEAALRSARANQRKAPLTLKARIQAVQVVQEVAQAPVPVAAPQQPHTAPTRPHAPPTPGRTAKRPTPGKAPTGDKKFKRRRSYLQAAADRFRVVATAWHTARLLWPLELLPVGYVGPAYEIKPLAIGTGAELIAHTPEGTGELIREGLRLWTTSVRYQRALAAEGSMRHGMDGKPVAEVSAADRANARRGLDKMNHRQRQPPADDEPPEPVPA